MAGPTIAEAVAAYLDGAELARSSRRTYGVPLGRMARELGPAWGLSRFLPEAVAAHLLPPGGIIEPSRPREASMTQATQPCQHVVGLQLPPRPGDVCEDCAPLGATWVSLRQCMACGHVGCCDSSPNRHARAHFQSVGHPVIRSAMPGDDWWFCFPDELTVRQQPDGRIVPIDLWWEAGIASVRRLLAERPAAELTAGARAANGFPVGDWAEQQRQAHAGGTLPPERVEALEGVPGWRW